MDYVISSDPSWVEVDVVWRFLSEESYWARGVPRETVLTQIPKLGEKLSEIMLRFQWANRTSEKLAEANIRGC